MGDMYGIKHCNGWSSGTTVVHIALGAVSDVVPQKVPELSEHSFFLLVVRLDSRLIHTAVAEFYCQHPA